MARPPELIDSLVAEGKEEFTFDEARAALDRSPTATANTLRRLQHNGLVNRLGRGHYAIRPLGSLHTSATTDDLDLAVGATFGDRQHRIAYLSALADLGLLSHPVRTITVACTTQVRVPAISGRPLRVVIERAETIHLEAEPIRRSWRSTLDRALFECALRIDLMGGVERLAEALATGATRADPHRLSLLAKAFGPRGSPPSVASPRSPMYSISRSSSPRPSGAGSRLSASTPATIRGPGWTTPSGWHGTSAQTSYAPVLGTDRAHPPGTEGCCLRVRLGLQSMVPGAVAPEVGPVPRQTTSGRVPPRCITGHDLHHTFTTTEWHLRSRTGTPGHSEMADELPKYKDVLLRTLPRHTFASYKRRSRRFAGVMSLNLPSVSWRAAVGRAGETSRARPPHRGRLGGRPLRERGPHRGWPRQRPPGPSGRARAPGGRAPGWP